MTTPTIVPVQYNGDATDFLKTKNDKDGGARIYTGTVSVPSGTAATATVGLVPFNKGARFNIHSTSVYCGDFGAGTTTAALGYVYNDNVTYTNAPTNWASTSTAPQSGGFITIVNNGLPFVAAADGWIVVTINTAAADATASIDYSFAGCYDGTAQSNQNGQA